MRDKGYAPSSGKVPDRHAPVRGRPGVAGHHSERTDSHCPQLLLSDGARVSLQMVKDQGGIPSRVARHGDGVLQL